MLKFLFLFSLLIISNASLAQTPSREDCMNWILYMRQQSHTLPSIADVDFPEEQKQELKPGAEWFNKIFKEFEKKHPKEEGRVYYGFIPSESYFPAEIDAELKPNERVKIQSLIKKIFQKQDQYYKNMKLLEKPSAENSKIVLQNQNIMNEIAKLNSEIHLAALDHGVKRGCYDWFEEYLTHTFSRMRKKIDKLNVKINELEAQVKK